MPAQHSHGCEETGHAPSWNPNRHDNRQRNLHHKHAEKAAELERRVDAEGVVQSAEPQVVCAGGADEEVRQRQEHARYRIVPAVATVERCQAGD